MTIHIDRNLLALVALAAAAAAILASARGVPLVTLLWIGSVVACPLAMMLMMGGMHGGSDHGNAPVDHEEPGTRNTPRG